MKLSVSLLALACVASANPLRVIIVSNNNGDHPIPAPRPVSLDGKLEPAVAQVIKPMMPPTSLAAGHAPCGGARGGFRFREKATAFADEVRIAFGFKPSSHWHGYQHPSYYEDLKMAKLTQFKTAVMPHRPEDVNLHGPSYPYLLVPEAHVPVPDQHPNGHHHRHQMIQGHHGHWRHAQPSFLMRVHFALMSLGAWEGRAVAFVLGCGIGVLLRMFWVLTVLTFRAVRGPSSAAEQYVILEGEDDDAEEIFVAPPMYTYPVEKVALPVEVPAIVVSEAEETK
ncbi:hypothetical protein C8R45DRAFT_580159 [Mycena sanguinolenta]|nr:hypothetical protein C8R45DRAFT_580159 [Mycena sanguinolenta]